MTTSEKEKLLALLRKDPLLYQQEIGLLSEDYPVPKFMRDSARVREISENSFSLRYLHLFQKRQEYLLSFDGSGAPILRYLAEVASAEEAPEVFVSNIDLGKAQVESPNYTYAAEGGKVLPTENSVEGLVIRRLSSTEGELLAPLQEEIDESGFTPYRFLQEMIAEGATDAYLALFRDQPAAFVHMTSTLVPGVGRTAEPGLILTAAAFRGKGIAPALLARVIHEHYRDCTVVYHAAEDNRASCRTAEKIGLAYLGSHYFYSPKLLLQQKS